MILVSAVLIIIVTVVFMVTKKPVSQDDDFQADETSDERTTQVSSPASVYCQEQGGEVEIITESDGSQFGLCNFSDYSCEEWAFMNGNCAIEDDAVLIREALVQKGLDLTDMKVVIKNHLGDDIEGMVVPVSAPAGGGYVFARKTDSSMEIVADGNGVIMCSWLEDYPDFSTYLIPECYDSVTDQVLDR